MQFQIKPVMIKNLVLINILLVIFSCQKSMNDDTVLLQKIISLEPNSILDTISKRANFTTKAIYNYHQIRFLNKSPLKIVEGYDKEKGKTIYGSKEEQQKLDTRFSDKFKKLDSLLTKKDVEFLIEQNRVTSNWKEEEINKIENEKIYLNNSTNRISKPIYSLNRKYALVCYDLYNTTKKIAVFKKMNNDWKHLFTIEDIL